MTSTSDHFVEGQTVVAKVTNVDEEKQRMLLSLRLSDCTLGDLATTSLLLLSQCLEERQGVRSLMSNRGGGNRVDSEGQGGAWQPPLGLSVPMSCFAPPIFKKTRLNF